MPAPALRPLSVGEMLDAAMKILVRNFLALAKATGVVVLPAALIVAIVEGSVVTPSNIVNPNTGQLQTSDLRTLGGAFVTIYAVTLVAVLFSSAICYKLVGDAYVGNKPDWRVALRFTARRLPSILWVSVVVFAYFGLLAVAGIVVIVLLAHVAPALAVLAGVALFVVFVWLVVPSGLAVPTFMMEGVKGGRAYRRAFRLVRGNWWRTLGLLLLTGLLSAVVSGIADAVFGLGLRAALGGTTAGRVFVDFLLFGVTYVCIHPFEGAVLVILSIDLRVRKEGYDVQLLASQLGVDPASVSLPYTRYPAGMQPGYPGAPGWGQPGYPTAPGWPAPSPGAPGWGQPGYTGAPGWRQPGQPVAPGWGQPGQPVAPGWGQPGQPVAPGWGQPGQPVAPGWGQPGQPVAPGWGQPGSPPSPGWTPVAQTPAVPARAGGYAAPGGPPGPGWWMASDGNWYPPELNPATQAPPGPGWWMASDGKWYAPELHPSARGGPGGPAGTGSASPQPGTLPDPGSPSDPGPPSGPGSPD